jgi:hypothetical protein
MCGKRERKKNLCVHKNERGKYTKLKEIADFYNLIKCKYNRCEVECGIIKGGIEKR